MKSAIQHKHIYFSALKQHNDVLHRKVFWDNIQKENQQNQQKEIQSYRIDNVIITRQIINLDNSRDDTSSFPTDDSRNNMGNTSKGAWCHIIVTGRIYIRKQRNIGLSSIEAGRYFCRSLSNRNPVKSPSFTPPRISSPERNGCSTHKADRAEEKQPST